MMKRFVLAGTAGLLMTGAAMATDAPMATDMSMAAGPGVSYDWSGLYAGAHVGGAWGDYSYVFSTGTDVGSDLSGWLGGGQLGYNFQTGSLVWGIEADISAADISGDSRCPNPAFSCNAAVKWFGTVRGRIGLPQNNWLFYATGGFAYGGVERTSAVTAPGLSQTKTLVGWTIGGGVDYAINSKWSVRGEYLYVDLDDESYPAATGGFSQVNIDAQFHVGRISVNYMLY
jgi:outer membrane immunogenic protein